MKLDEAYTALELSPGASEDDIKKQFKKLAAKYHPDVNKEAGAEANSKRISEAYAILKDPSKAEQNFAHPPNNGIWDFIEQNFGGFGSSVGFGGQQRPPPNYKRPAPLQPKITINFADSVKGVTKEISFDRDIRCDNCQGKGCILKENCTICKGKGTFTSRQGNFFIQNACGSCRGTGGKFENCTGCNGCGVVNNSSVFTINIPPGVTETIALRLSNAGHFNPLERRYEEIFIQLKINPLENMKLDGNDVISTIRINLLQALEGSEIDVNTVFGEKKLTVQPKSKNADKVILKNCGVAEQGSHVFNIELQYPEDCSKLIEILKNEPPALLVKEG